MHIWANKVRDRVDGVLERVRTLEERSLETLATQREAGALKRLKKQLADVKLEETNSKTSENELDATKRVRTDEA